MSKDQNKEKKKAAESARRKKNESILEESNATESPVRQHAQATITQLLKGSNGKENKEGEDLSSLLSSLEKRVRSLPTVDFIKGEFEKLITEEALTLKLDSLKKELKENFKKELDAAYSVIKTVEKKQQSSDRKVTDLRNKVSDMETKIVNLEEENVTLRELTQSLTDRLKDSNEVIKASEVSMNNLEQYSRINNIRIYGIDDRKSDETPTETTEVVSKFLRNRLGMSIINTDIDIAHRLGPFREDGNRPIICKFMSRRHKIEAISLRKCLKGSGIGIREDLTRKNAKLLEEAADNDNVKSVWSDHGKIIALLNKKKKTTVVVDLRTDLKKPLKPKKKKTAVNEDAQSQARVDGVSGTDSDDSEPNDSVHTGTSRSSIEDRSYQQREIEHND